MQPTIRQPGDPERPPAGRSRRIGQALPVLILIGGAALVGVVGAMLVRAGESTPSGPAPIAQVCSAYLGPGGATSGPCPTLTPQPWTGVSAQPLPTPTAQPSTGVSAQPLPTPTAPPLTGVSAQPLPTPTAPPLTGSAGSDATPAAGSYYADRSYTILQGQTVTTTVTAPAGSPDLVVSVNWKSGATSTDVTSPGGRLITAATQASDVTHDGDPTWQYYLISFPEIGVWTITTTGVSVEPGGEKVSVNVEAMPPIPPEVMAFANPSSGKPPLTVSFTASANDLEGGTITSYIWDFGDGSSGSGPAPTHTYTADGSYVATLTVTSSEGEQASSSTEPIVVGSTSSPGA
jgi:PKD repeat protein